MINFALGDASDLNVTASGTLTTNAVMHLALNAEVIVVGKRTFANLADVENPAENLVGVAQSASQGAITARQLDVRPIMRAGEVLETVPGMIITQHSGDGKANQYFLRGFNLDHGTDFAIWVDGMPVNMPTHAHGQGYADINFMIPELVAGVQYFARGPTTRRKATSPPLARPTYGYFDVLPATVGLVTLGTVQIRSRARRGVPGAW